MDRGGPDPAGAGERLLAAVGVGELDERVYTVLLEHPRSTLDELADRLALPRRRTRAALRRLEASGLVSVVPERPVRYLTAPPDVAVEALIMRRQEDLHRTRLAVARLWERIRENAPRTGNGDELVEIVTGRDMSVQRFEQMLTAAEEEVLIFDRPPYAEPGEINPVERKALARGIVYRAVYDSLSLDRPGAVDRISGYIAAGEQARVFSPLPLKLVIVDRRIGLLPLDVHDPDLSGSLLVRPSGLLDVLVMFFETVWQRAVPIHLTDDGTRLGTAAGPTGADGRLVALLAAGLKDEAIARQLGMSARTLDRRLAVLMRDLDARTRFQAGWAAALRQAAQSSE